MGSFLSQSFSIKIYLQIVTNYKQKSSSKKKTGQYRCYKNNDVTVINTVTGQTLSLSYGRCIAEFLKKGSLVRLGLLDLSTCVGLRYGRP